MSSTKETLNSQVSDEMITFMLKSYPYFDVKTQVGSRWYIGYHHLTHRYGTLEKITKPKAKKLLLTDIREIENYHLIKNIKNKVEQHFYDICVNFTYDYGKQVLKNSKIYFYIKTQNLDKCIEELEKYKTFQSVFEPKMVKRRDFDIHVLKNNIYKNKENAHGDTKRHTKQNVGFRY